MSDQELVDMFDRLDSTRVKLRLRSRRLWSTVAESEEESDVHTSAPPSTPDDAADGPVPLGGYC